MLRKRPLVTILAVLGLACGPGDPRGAAFPPVARGIGSPPSTPGQGWLSSSRELQEHILLRQSLKTGADLAAAPPVTSEPFPPERGSALRDAPRDVRRTAFRSKTLARAPPAPIA